MFKALTRTLPLLLSVAALGAHAQSFLHSDYYKTHGFSLSVGATGNFDQTLTMNPNVGVLQAGTPYNPPVAVSNQKQFTTQSLGFVSSLQFHPKPWAGLELNYGFTHRTEVYEFNYATLAATQKVNIPTDMHEFTGAYQFHPKHIPFQPFVNIGGGAIDFAPNNASNQFRGAGLLEAGFDVPTHSSHIGFRIEGRSLYYRAPNYYSPQISTGSWRVTTQPSVSTYYRF